MTDEGRALLLLLAVGLALALAVLVLLHRLASDLRKTGQFGAPLDRLPPMKGKNRG